MNVQDYIASGILEEYMIGSVSNQEKREVECMAGIYPEIREALDGLSVAMEKYAQLHQITPPSHLKEQIFSKLSFNQELDAKTEQVDTKETQIEVIKETKVRSLWPLSMAAAVLLTFVCGYLYFQNRDIKAALLASKTETESKESLIAMYQNADLEMVVMNGTDKYSQAKATIFWNKKTAEVSLLTQQLPPIDSSRQYQLWVIADSKPVDMGVFDASTKSNVMSMKSTANGQAFAITIEKRGGSPTPTMEEMCVLGKTSAE